MLSKIASQPPTRLANFIWATNTRTLFFLAPCSKTWVEDRYLLQPIFQLRLALKLWLCVLISHDISSSHLKVYYLLKWAELLEEYQMASGFGGGGCLALGGRMERIRVRGKLSIKITKEFPKVHSKKFRLILAMQ